MHCDNSAVLSLELFLHTLKNWGLSYCNRMEASPIQVALRVCGFGVALTFQIGPHLLGILFSQISNILYKNCQNFLQFNTFSPKNFKTCNYHKFQCIAKLFPFIKCICLSSDPVYLPIYGLKCKEGY